MRAQFLLTLLALSPTSGFLPTPQLLSTHRQAHPSSYPLSSSVSRLLSPSTPACRLPKIGRTTNRMKCDLRMVLGRDNSFEEPELVAERIFKKSSKVEQKPGDEDRGSESKIELPKKMEEKVVFEHSLKRPLGLILREIHPYGVYVESVSEGSAKDAGVQRGDRIMATSATFGGQMWEKNTMEGVMAAVHSSGVSGKVGMRFERDPVLASIVCFGRNDQDDTSRVDLGRALISVQQARIRIQETASETFDITLPLPGGDMRHLRGLNLFTGGAPYGLKLREVQAEGGKTAVEVASIEEGGTAADSGLLRPGDRIVASQSSVGDSMWPKTTMDGLGSAVATRMGKTIKLRVERQVQLGSWQNTSPEVVKASPRDKVAYFSTSGARGVANVVARSPQGVNGLTKRRPTLATSLAILPDEKGWDKIQEVRQTHDRRVDLWPPHITLVKPFVRGEDFPSASVMLSEVLQEKVPPFEIRMELATFTHHQNCTSVWLVPDAESQAKVKEVQKISSAVFPQCAKPPRHLAFDPHMTLGQFATEADAKTFVALIREKLEGLTFPVSNVFLLSRPDKAQQAVDQLRVSLGATQTNTPLSQAVFEYSQLRKAGASLEDSTTRNVLLERCSYDVMTYGRTKNITGIDQMVEELRSSEVDMDAKFLNVLMMSMLKCSQPQKAVDYFNEMTANAAKGPGTIWVEAAAKFAVDPEAKEPKSINGFNPVVPNVQCYATLIKALGRAGDLKRAHKVIDKMTREGPAPNIRVINSLLEACVRNNDLKSAMKLFSSLRGTKGAGSGQLITPDTDMGLSISLQPTEVSYNIMINAFAKNKMGDQAFSFLLEMKATGCQPDKITYTSLIKACMESGQLSRAEGLLDEMEANGVEADSFTYNAILRGLGKRVQWQKAKKVLERMKSRGVEPDLYTYSAIINVCVKANKIRDASRFFQNMQEEGIVPNVQIYSTLMSGYSKRGWVDDAQKLLEQMQEQRIRPNEYTFSALMEAYLQAGYPARALKIYSKLKGTASLKEDQTISVQHMRALALSGDFDGALAKFDHMRILSKDKGKKLGTVVYNELMSCCVLNHNREELHSTFMDMLSDKIEPVRRTYTVLASDKTLQGMKRCQFFLDLIADVRAKGLTPMGPIYIAALEAALEAGEPELAEILIREEERERGFIVAKEDKEKANQMKVRVSNLKQANSKGQWYERAGVPVRSGRLGSVTGIDNNWEFRTDEESESARPEDRGFYSAEWW